MSEAARNLLSSHAFLAGFPPRPSRSWPSHADTATFRPGVLLFREGSPADVTYFITKGCVSIEVHVPNRGPMVVETLRPGQVVGLSWAAASLPVPVRCPCRRRGGGGVCRHGAVARGACGESHGRVPPPRTD